MSGANSVNALCVSKQKCVFAQQDTALAADGSFCLLPLPNTALSVCVCVCVAVCVFVLRVFLEDLSSLHMHHLFEGILYQRGLVQLILGSPPCKYESCSPKVTAIYNLSLSLSVSCRILVCYPNFNHYGPYRSPPTRGHDAER